MNSFKNNKQGAFFFQQTEIKTLKGKRPKKVLDEQTLNNLSKKINSKFQLNDDTFEGNARSLSARLADLHTTHSVTSNYSATSSQSRASLGPNAFTDTRLQAIKFLTEDTIKELEELLIAFSTNKIQPNLPVQVVYECHSDWSDLTEKCSYKNFPTWRSKHGKDLLVMKRASLINKKDEGKRTSSRVSNDQGPDSNDKERTTSSTKSKNSTKQIQKLNSISEIKAKPVIPVLTKFDIDAARQHSRNHSIHDGASSVVSRRLSKRSSPVPAQKSRTDIASRLTHNTSNSTGCLLNYQLSNFVFKDKGWTVVIPNLEEQSNESERIILSILSNSLRNIEDLRNFYEKYGFNLKSKIRFYGDHKKEQIEKYKTSNLKPKKSLFAMCILRYEIPRPLDLKFMLETYANPNLAISIPPINQRPIKSASSYATATTLISSISNQKKLTNFQLSNGIAQINSNQINNANNKESTFIDSSLLFNAPKPPPLFNIQTNDGTNCVYYPNGQTAILVANVFGFFVENISNTSVLPSNLDPPLMRLENKNLLNTNLISTSFNNANAMNGPGLVWQNIKDSFTTTVFGISENSTRKSSKFPFGVNSNQEATINDDNFKKDSIKNKLFNKQNKNSDSKLLAIITSTGSCVCYRENGNPRFVCTESGGCLCDKKGAVSYQWKWDDLNFVEYDQFKNNLNVDLNEFIRLEYKNPFNIRLKFSCNKETINFELGCNKGNASRLNEMLTRTVSDLPMKSNTGQLRITASAKASAIASYKQHQLMQQQQIPQQPLGRKTSIYFNDNNSVNTNKENTKDFHKDASNNTNKDTIKDSKIEKLLENTISYKDIPVMRDLLFIQKKIRNILEEWLSYCRNSLGMMDPNMYLQPMLPNKHEISRLNKNHNDFDKIVLHRRKSRSVLELAPPASNMYDSDSKYSAKSFNKIESKKSLSPSRNQIKFEDHSQRAKSAFITRKASQLTKEQLDLIDKIKVFRSQINKENMYSSSNSVKFQNKTALLKHGRALNNLAKSLSSASWITNNNNDLGNKSSNQEKNQFQDFFTDSSIFFKQNKLTKFFNKSSDYLNENQMSIKRTYSNENLIMLCPVTLHYRLAFNRFDIDCRCRKNYVPFINDIEYDALIRILPADQLAVVAIVDSSNGPSNTKNIILGMYTNYNRNRIQPCKESIKDECRFFLYDIRSAADNSNHTHPMLVYRHNVAPGMVLIYKNSKLIFCDHIFNGYGYSQQDFIKQLNKSRNDANDGKFLPYNFRFNYPIGKSGMRTAWGGQIGGIDETSSFQEELIPYLGTFRSVENNTSNLSRLFLSNSKENEKIHLPKINKFLTSSLEV